MTLRRRCASSSNDGFCRTIHFYLARMPHLVATSIVVVVFVAFTSSGGAHALHVSPSSSSNTVVGSSSSSLISAGPSVATRRRSPTTTTLYYRNTPNDVDDDGPDIGRYYYSHRYAGASSYMDGPQEGGASGGFVLEENTDVDVDVDDDDPLSRELRHGHFPDAVMTALSTAIFPNIKFPTSWIRASEAMENIVGGAGGAGLFLHLNEAARAYDGDAHDDSPTTPRRRPSSFSPPSTSARGTTFADGLVETAKAFVPVVVEFAAVAAVANYFD